MAAHIGIGTRKRAAITTRLGLVRYVAAVLSSKWVVHVDEVDSVSVLPSLRPHAHRYFQLIASLEEPFSIFCVVTARTLTELVARVDVELWEDIKRKFEKHAVQWVKPGEADVIEGGQRRIGSRPQGLGHKQLSLTYQPTDGVMECR